MLHPTDAMGPKIKVTHEGNEISIDLNDQKEDKNGIMID